MATEKRLIDANALRKQMFSYYGCVNEQTSKLSYVGETLMNYEVADLIEDCIDNAPTVDAVEVIYGTWEDGRCSNCQEEALSTSWDEPIYDYDWEENLRYSHTETHTEYHLTDYCPNCGAKMMEGDGNA